jgi:hypothetical protein
VEIRHTGCLAGLAHGYDLHFSVQSKSRQTDYLAPEIKETRWEDKASKSKLMSLNLQGTELSIIIPTPPHYACDFILCNLPV